MQQDAEHNSGVPGVAGQPSPWKVDGSIFSALDHRFETQVHDVQPPDPPERLFHYTSSEGLLGILEAADLWATDVRYMNDATEFEHGLGLIRDGLAPLMADHRPSVKTFAEAASGLLDGYRRNLNVYAACFCESGDLLSQWRGYSRGVGGFAIGFESRHFLPRLTPTFKLIKVLYDEQRQRELVGELIGGIVSTLAEVKTAGAVGGDLAAEGAFGLVDWTFHDLALRFKNPGFSEEQEWRLVLVHSSWPPDLARLVFRQRAAELFPSMPLGLAGRESEEFEGRLPIREVVYGPSPHRDLVSETVLSLLSKHGYRGITVRGSAIPLRA
jgi:hypothetical protein